jgi:hypothetical protein
MNGETCYVLLTDHFSGRIFGRAFATKAPPVDWVNSWLASNAPKCIDKYVRMDGGGELGNVETSTAPSQISDMPSSSLAPIHRTKMDPANVRTRPSAMLFAPCFPGQTCSQISGHTLSTTTCVSTISFPTAIDHRVRMKCVVPRSQIWQSFGRLDVDCTFAQRPLATAVSSPTPDSEFSLVIPAL